MSFIKSICLLFLLIVLLAFSNDEEIKSSKILLFNKFNLQIPEPSGLAFTFPQKHLLIVSDNNSKIYKTDFSGNIINEKIIDGNDLEGIAIKDDEMFLVSDKSEILYHFKIAE